MDLEPSVFPSETMNRFLEEQAWGKNFLPLDVYITPRRMSVRLAKKIERACRCDPERAARIYPFSMRWSALKTLHRRQDRINFRRWVALSAAEQDRQILKAGIRSVISGFASFNAIRAKLSSMSLEGVVKEPPGEGES